MQEHGTSVVLLFLSCLSSFSVSVSPLNLAADDKHTRVGFLLTSLSLGSIPSRGSLQVESQCDIRKTVVEPHPIVKTILHHPLPRGMTSTVPTFTVSRVTRLTSPPQEDCFVTVMSSHLYRKIVMITRKGCFFRHSIQSGQVGNTHPFSPPSSSVCLLPPPPSPFPRVLPCQASTPGTLPLPPSFSGLF